MGNVDPSAVQAHYERGGDVAERIFAALRLAGKDPAAPSLDDLAPHDQFHLGGREATRALAGLAALRPGLEVVDVGGGLGGPARTLAAEFGCRVTVLDLTEAFCAAGRLLTERTGLTDRVTFRQGNACAMPFADASFDLAWTQHSSMNIADKERLYAEIHRVVRPGGRLALHEIMAGPNQPPHFPVPWAAHAGLSDLRTPEAVRALLAEPGFVEVAWRDVTASAREALGTALSSPPQPGDRLAGNDELSTMFQTLARNIDERRVVVVQAVFDRP